MADRVDIGTRSRIMRAIRRRDTRPELALAHALSASGVPHARDVPLDGTRGRPDFLVRGWLVVLVHGCFWHGCPQHGKPPADQAWREKLARNSARDARTIADLEAMGYEVVVAWEHEDMMEVAGRVAAMVKGQLGRRPVRPVQERISWEA